MSERKKVLFVPFNAAGHINISVGLADRLRDDHGYRTIFLLLEPAISSVITTHNHELITIKKRKCNDVSSQQENGTKTNGFENKNCQENGEELPTIALAAIKMRKTFELEPVDRIIEVMKGFVAMFIDEFSETLGLYIEEVRKLKPDLVFTEYLSFTPQFHDAIGDSPWIYLYPGNPFPLTVSKIPGLDKIPGQIGLSLMKSKADREKLRREKPEEWTALVDGWRRIQQRLVESNYYSLPDFKKFLQRFGVTGEVEMFHERHDSPYLNIYVTPAEIDYDQEDDICAYRKRWIRCDSLVRKSENITNPAEAAYWSKKIDIAMEGKTELVYFSLGTLASGDLELMKMYVSYFREDKERLYVISKGSQGDKFELSEDNMIGANHVPQTFILQRANLAVIHGGNNSLTECLYNGVPMIVLPVFADQLDNAQRIEDLELGKRLDVLKCTKEEILGAIDEILKDQSITKRYKEISENMKARDDLGKISSIIQKLIEDKSLDQSYIDCYTKN